MTEVTERDREAANRLFFLCGSLGDFDAACAFLAEWREARLAEERAARLKAEARLRAVIEAAEGLERRYEDKAVVYHNAHAHYPAFSLRREDCTHEECVYMRQALAVYRSRVRDAQASPEPDWWIAWWEAVQEKRKTLLALDASPEPDKKAFIVGDIDAPVAVTKASPEPKASHKFEPIAGSLTSCCAVCTLPWSQHGGRDAR